jgi:hypothetical protein
MGRTTVVCDLIATLAAGALISACKPSVGRAPSLIVGPEILAIRPQPAEGRPGETITYDLLVVSTDGTDANPVASWDVCTTPKAPAENNSVSATCVSAPPGDTQGTTFTAPVPTDACTLFGPIPPSPKPGQPSYRPRDPDTTGGYYLPVRAVMTGLGDRTLTAFSLERITCPLVGASPTVIQDYNTRRKPNQNPAIAGLDMVLSDGTHTPLAGTTTSVGSGAEISLQAAFTSESAEAYLIFDANQQSLVDRRESLRFSWFATDGEFEHDRTGRAEDDFATTSDNAWTASTVSAPTPVHMWLVLRDSRGGVDFAGYEIMVSP